MVAAYVACFGLNDAQHDASAISVLRTAIRKELGRHKKVPEDLDRSYIAIVTTSVEGVDALGRDHPGD